MGKVLATCSTMPTKEIWKSLVAEFVSTFLLLFVGCGSALYFKGQEAPPLVDVALAFGIMIASLVQVFSHVSGCHMNPAATLAFLVTGKIELVKSVLYIVTQCVAAILGVALLQGFTPSNIQGKFAVLSVSPELSAFQAVVIEFIICFIFLFLVFAVSDENRKDVLGSPSLAVGLSVVVLILGAGNHTGAGINPARALGPAVITGHWKHHWVYWVGCITGSMAGGLMYHHVFSMPKVKVIQSIEMSNFNPKKVDHDHDNDSINKDNLNDSL